MSSTYRDFNRALIQDLRAHGGKATSGPFKGRDVLILTTKGAKSGEVRENPLVYTSDGDHYLIVGSTGGAPTHPSWYHNLVAHPDVTVEVQGEKFKARAHVAEGDEYERLYQHHASTNP
jgi:deazaflavin-dependent oxidoreductase (nitroreductase family)